MKNPTLLNTLWLRLLAILWLAGYGLTPIAYAASKAQPAPPVSPAETYFTNVLLINQDDKPRHFYRDLLQGKVVIINSFFSACTGSCPVSMGILAKVQQRFEKQMGKELHFVSISLDPEMDTPPKLKALAEKLHTGPGWQLLTGDKRNVDFALKKIGHFVEDIATHNNTLIVGNETTGLWKKAFTQAGPDALVEVIASVLDDTGAPVEN